MVAFGGQTPLNLAAPLVRAGVPLLGSSLEAIDQAEERTRFSALLDRLGIPQPEGGMAESIEEALTLAERIGYPVIVRPSFVIGGLAIDFAYSPEDLARHLAAAAVVDPDRPVRIDRFLEGIEVDVDAVCDGKGVLIPGLLEHVERAGVHSGDSIGVFPPQHVAEGDRDLIVWTMERICLALGARGLVNAQFIVREDGVYLIEVNPRASRTVPFLSKVTGVPMVELAVRISLGATLAELGWATGLRPDPPFVAVKAPAFSTAKLKGVDPSVGPFMQSTGEVIGIADDPRVAMAKALTGASLIPPRTAETRARRRSRCSPSPTATSGACSTSHGRSTSRATGWRRRPGRATCSRGRVRGRAGREAGRGAGAGEAGILELIADGHVRLVVNTPTPRSGAVRDAADIRHAAIAEGVLCLTAIETAVAAAEALAPDIADEIAKVRPITDWVPMGAGRLAGRPDPRRSRVNRPSSSPSRPSGSTAPAPPAPPRSTGRATTASASSARPSRPPAGTSRRRTLGSRRLGVLILRWRMSRGGFDAASAAMSCCARTCPAHAPSTCPPTTAASCTVQTSPGGRNALLGRKKAVPNRSDRSGAGRRRRRRSAGRRRAGRSGSGRRDSRRRSASAPRRWRPR